MSLTFAVIFQSSDTSVINMLGLVIYMTGITLHVVRKAASVETRGYVERSSTKSGEVLVPVKASNYSKILK